MWVDASAEKMINCKGKFVCKYVKNSPRVILFLWVVFFQIISASNGLVKKALRNQVVIMQLKWCLKISPGINLKNIFIKFFR
jgi:hypothetical protein